MDNNLLYKSFASANSIVFCQLSGHLLLDNMKMEKQRTGLSYNKIFKKFRNNGINGLYSGFLPWGALLGYGKGFIVGGVSYKLKNYFNNKNYNSSISSIYTGLGSGICEAIYMNPIMIARNKINLNQTKQINNRSFLDEIKFSSRILKKNIKKEGITSLYNGCSLLIFRRSLDWSSRFLFIDLLNNYYKNLKNRELNFKESSFITMIGSASTTPITTPIDRVLPILYTNGKNKAFMIIKNKIKTEGYKTFFSGLVFRSISTGYYTLFLFCIPKLLF